jgi:hypothetical protein
MEKFGIDAVGNYGHPKGVARLRQFAQTFRIRHDSNRVFQDSASEGPEKAMHSINFRRQPWNVSSAQGNHVGQTEQRFGRESNRPARDRKESHPGVRSIGRRHEHKREEGRYDKARHFQQTASISAPPKAPHSANEHAGFHPHVG